MVDRGAAAPTAFFRQALREAERYGADRWVLVRELVQNARDAGASRVELTAECDDTGVRLVCRDNGEGMTFAHAESYLFTLYASSKERQPDAAGRFGVGFWSVLRMAPDRIVVRSCPRGGSAWEVELSENLTTVRQRAATLDVGTEVVLERAEPELDIAEQVEAAARRDVSLVTCRDDPHRALEVLVNGISVQRDMELPPPSMSFRRGSIRGAVGFGTESRIELYSRGLLVRTAGSFDELLSARRDSRQHAVGGTDSAGLAPVVMLDSPELQVLLARTDVCENAALERLVDVGQRELQRLVRHQLDRGFAVPLWHRVRRWAVHGVVRWIALVAAAVVVGWLVGRSLPIPGGGGARVAGEANLGAPFSASAVRDLGARYPGAVVDPPSGAGRVTPELNYRPVELELLLAGAVVDAQRGARMLEAGSLEVCAERTPRAGPEVQLHVRLTAGHGPVRLPVPTGHGIVAGSVLVEDQSVVVRCTAAGEPVLSVGRQPPGPLVSYRTQPMSAIVRSGTGEPLDPVAEAVADQVMAADAATTVARTTEWLRARMRYSRSPEVVREHQELAAAGAGFVDRCLTVGAGDCDVINGVLVALLRASGVPSRLVIGWVGRDGRAVGRLHAWAEVLLDGQWVAVDATVPMSVSAGAPRSAPLSTDPSSTAVVPPAGTALRLSRPDWWFVLVAGVAVILLMGTVRWWRRRSRSRLHLQDQVDPAAWVQAALESSQAGSAMAEVWARPLVPLLDRRISLARARRLAEDGQLWSTAGSSQLARSAAASGRAVIDRSQSAGEVVASVLDAVDLDLWQGWLSRTVAEPLTRQLTSAARGSWRFAVARGVPHSPQVMIQPATDEERWVVWADDDPVLQAARQLVAEGCPRRAELLMLESADGRGMSREWTELLVTAARAALEELATSKMRVRA